MHQGIKDNWPLKENCQGRNLTIDRIQSQPHINPHCFLKVAFRAHKRVGMNTLDIPLSFKILTSIAMLLELVIVKKDGRLDLANGHLGDSLKSKDHPPTCQYSLTCQCSQSQNTTQYKSESLLFPRPESYGIDAE